MVGTIAPVSIPIPANRPLVGPTSDLGGLVEIIVRGDHPYRSRGKNKNGCAVRLADGSECRKAKTHPDHLGIPLSLNVIGSRGGHHTYNAFKVAWQEVIAAQLETIGFPKGLYNSISAESLICFPKMPRVGRDQGNFRWLLEKCLGDALTLGGWIPDDSYWPERHFEHGGLQMTYEPGVMYTRIMLFPS